MFGSKPFSWDLISQLCYPPAAGVVARMDMDLSDKEDNGTKRRGRPRKPEGPSSSDRPQKRAKKSEQEGPRPGSKRKRSHDDEPDSDNDDNEAEGAQQNAEDLALQGSDEWCFCSAPVYQRFWFCK